MVVVLPEEMKRSAGFFWETISGFISASKIDSMDESSVLSEREIDAVIGSFHGLHTC